MRSGCIFTAAGSIFLLHGWPVVAAASCNRAIVVSLFTTAAQR